VDRNDNTRLASRMAIAAKMASRCARLHLLDVGFLARAGAAGMSR
jgi:hypothetical protein